MSVRGWAIKRNGVIDPSTVSATETAAKAKWLMSSFGFLVAPFSIDETSREFDRVAPRSTEYPTCIRVNITEVR